MEPFVHALIPMAFLLALFPNLDKKYLFFLVPIVWIIDLDNYIGIHRFTFHNLFFVLFLAFLAYLFWKTWTAFWVAFYYGFSHILLDLSLPGTGWFYPVFQKTIYLNASIYKSTEWIINLSIGSLSIEEYYAVIQTVGPLRYVGEASVLFILLFALLLGIKYKEKIQLLLSPKKNN